MTDLLVLYRAEFKTTIAGQFQYRGALVIWLIGPRPAAGHLPVCLVDRRAIAGGAIDGFTADDFAAYYLSRAGRLAGDVHLDHVGDGVLDPPGNTLPASGATCPPHPPAYRQQSHVQAADHGRGDTGCGGSDDGLPAELRHLSLDRHRVCAGTGSSHGAPLRRRMDDRLGRVLGDASQRDQPALFRGVPFPVGVRGAPRPSAGAGPRSRRVAPVLSNARVPGRAAPGTAQRQSGTARLCGPDQLVGDRGRAAERHVGARCAPVLGGRGLGR